MSDRQRSEPSPALPAFLLARALDGVAAGWAVLLGLVWTDVGRIGTLMDRSDTGELAMGVLALVFAVTFGPIGVAVGWAFRDR
jgi:hypothetical protein